MIVGAGENAAIAYEYFTHDSLHTVVAFGVEREFLDATELYSLPIVALDELPQRFPPSDHLAFVAISWTHLNRVRMRLYGAIKAAGYECASYVSSNAFAWHNVRSARTPSCSRTTCSSTTTRSATARRSATAVSSPPMS